ncbi:MAG: hypothetical protein KAX81_03350 [Leadbetterella sp.]|nr:hypothetical protein [Leadbetterella sp.]MBP8156037.1 hypothetical protein [Leadbetterella sp.]
MKKFSIFILLFILLSCKEEFAFKKETFYLLPNTRNWKVDAEKYNELRFVNSKNEKLVLALNYEREEFSPSKTTVAGIPTKIDKYEQLTQMYNGEGRSFSLIMNSFNLPLGNLVNVHLDKINFSLKISSLELFNVSNNNDYFTNPNYSGGGGKKIQSTVKYEYSYKIKNETIPQILIFELNDGTIEDNDIKLMAMAPQMGLIYFKTKNGVEYWRENF